MGSDGERKGDEKWYLQYNGLQPYGIVFAETMKRLGAVIRAHVTLTCPDFAANWTQITSL